MGSVALNYGTFATGGSGGGGGSPGTVAPAYWNQAWVSSQGEDATAKVGNPWLPYQSLTAAGVGILTALAANNAGTVGQMNLSNDTFILGTASVLFCTNGTQSFSIVGSGMGKIAPLGTNASTFTPVGGTIIQSLMDSSTVGNLGLTDEVPVCINPGSYTVLRDFTLIMPQGNFTPPNFYESFGIGWIGSTAGPEFPNFTNWPSTGVQYDRIQVIGNYACLYWAGTIRGTSTNPAAPLEHWITNCNFLANFNPIYFDATIIDNDGPFASSAMNMILEVWDTNITSVTYNGTGPDFGTQSGYRSYDWTAGSVQIIHHSGDIYTNGATGTGAVVCQNSKFGTMTFVAGAAQAYINGTATTIGQFVGTGNSGSLSPINVYSSFNANLSNDDNKSVTRIVTGVPFVAATAALTSQTVGVSPVATYTTQKGGTFEMSGYVNVTAVTTDQLTPTVSFTDEAGNSRTITLTPVGSNTGAISATGFNSLQTALVRAQAGSALTFQTTLTTVGGSIAYDVGAVIEQVA